MSADLCIGPTLEISLIMPLGLHRGALLFSCPVKPAVLEIADIRVERLQEISEADAIGEGVEWWHEERLKSRPKHYRVYCDYDNPKDPAQYTSSAVDSFSTLWQSINGPESWNQNPWVWVIEFKRIEQ
jgi:hypothetical protein